MDRGPRSIACACGDLAQLIYRYHTTAVRYYSDNPEAMSIMVLVLLELWTAVDDIAISICPLLKEYSPGIPHEPLQNLLLPFNDQMERLQWV